MKNDGAANSYDIAVRQFQQQVLPGGVWAALSPACAADPDCNHPATTVWSYGPDADDTPAIAPDPDSQFNYPAYTIETLADTPVSVRWINDLIDPATGNYLPHLLPIDQTLHWANPPAVGCRDGSNRTDCATNNPAFYTGPVPMVTHVHGAHVNSDSDGYPEAWWLPAANDIPPGYATSGALFDDANGQAGGTGSGYADFAYRNDQPATTLWYHDHTLGMTRSNVYAGSAGFWLVRGGPYDMVTDGKSKTGKPAVLPGPAPVAGQGVLALNVPGNPVRSSIREIPIVIQDRSFNWVDANGNPVPEGDPAAVGTRLFYPDNRAFFEGLNQPPTVPYLDIPFVPNSDIAPIWNPEAFFNTMVVNGTTWPSLEVAPAKYRFRLLNGCNSRFLNLALVYPEVGSPKNKMKEIPFFQIGAEQGFLPQVVEVLTGFATPLPGDGSHPKHKDRVPASDPQQALLMGLAERADVIVDFHKLPDGTRVRMINTAPDAPFGGFPDAPADPSTTGQVMEFVVNSALLQPSDSLTTSPYRLQPHAESPLPAGEDATRQLSLNEQESATTCWEFDMAGNLVEVPGSTPPLCALGGEPVGPKEALLGTVDLGNPAMPLGNALKWTDTTGASTPVNVTLQNGAVIPVNVTENPTVGDTEVWEIYNFTADAHPIHLHLVRFEVLGRAAIPGFIPVNPVVQPWEAGFKDTVISYPGEITTVKALFDIPGLYVWHCHIVEHEDNEMMRPYVVSPQE
jgi:spore coat protein A